MRKFNPIILLAALIFALVLWQRHAPSSQPGLSDPASVALGTARVAREPASSIDLPAFLPTEARDTIERIRHGGPFEHSQDGVVFGNYERLLPAEPRGYYHEYTVETPGARTRGARRIIAGGTPPVVFYYTGDHYRSFRRFRVRQ
jgi:guanyl-specific ribonuclease Sa